MKNSASIKRILYRFTHPFKGGSAYEWQIGPVVFLIFYPHSLMQPYRTGYKFVAKWDLYWKK